MVITLLLKNASGPGGCGQSGGADSAIRIHRWRYMGGPKVSEQERVWGIKSQPGEEMQVGFRAAQIWA